MTIYARNIQQGINPELLIQGMISRVAKRVLKYAFECMAVGTSQADDSSKKVAAITVPAVGNADGQFNFGYGNQVLIDHGFGYKTRYAHLKTIGVAEGMKIKRGECIGISGNSGRSSGPHLHYEVLYKDRHVNPANYFDLTITPEEYATMVQNTADASQKITLHPSHRKRNR